MEPAETGCQGRKVLATPIPRLWRFICVGLGICCIFFNPIFRGSPFPQAPFVEVPLYYVVLYITLFIYIPKSTVYNCLSYKSIKNLKFSHLQEFLPGSSNLHPQSCLVVQCSFWVLSFDRLDLRLPLLLPYPQSRYL